MNMGKKLHALLPNIKLCLRFTSTSFLARRWLPHHVKSINKEIPGVPQTECGVEEVTWKSGENSKR